jgi:hypothetical protein
VLDPRFAAVGDQAALAREAAIAEGAAARQATAAVSAAIEQHSEALLEMAEHFSARLDLALAALERIESRIATCDAEPSAAPRPTER